MIQYFFYFKHLLLYFGGLSIFLCVFYRLPSSTWFIYNEIQLFPSLDWIPYAKSYLESFETVLAEAAVAPRQDMLKLKLQGLSLILLTITI